MPNFLSASSPAASSRPLVLGAGPAGLTAALLLARRGLRPLVLEAGDQVGGLARTVERDGFRFDLGGHRFFTKSREVEALWHEVAGSELEVRPRLSRIHWRGRFLRYPLRGGDVVREVGPLELTRCALSYAAARLRPQRPAETFEEWVCARFGRRLFELFFKSYTEKVWGVPTSEIRAEWAAQRIKGLSLGSAVRTALFGDGGEVRTLIESFLYPRLGPGQLWEAIAAEVEDRGGTVALSTPVTGLEPYEDGTIAVETHAGRHRSNAVVSSLPLQSVVALAGSHPPARARHAAAGLRYRDFITVALALRGEAPFPDNWIYVHDPDARVGRIQNFGAWSEAMVPPGRACVGLEYFCFEGDELWRRPNEELIELATAELAKLGLASPEDVERGWAVRVQRAYPIYDAEYAERIAEIRHWLDPLPGLVQVGRNGLHRYNNSDHSMLTAMRAVDNICDGAGHDIWAVNADDAYHEEEPQQPYRRAPETPAMAASQA